MVIEKIYVYRFSPFPNILWRPYVIRVKKKSIDQIISFANVKPACSAEIPFTNTNHIRLLYFPRPSGRILWQTGSCPCLEANFFKPASRRTCHKFLAGGRFLCIKGMVSYTGERFFTREQGNVGTEKHNAMTERHREK